MTGVTWRPSSPAVRTHYLKRAALAWGKKPLFVLFETTRNCTSALVEAKCFLEELQVCEKSQSAAGPHDSLAHCAIPGCKIDPV